MTTNEKFTYTEVQQYWEKRALEDNIDIIKKRGDVFWDAYEKGIVLDVVARQGKNSKILDLGCGTGRIAEFLQSQGYNNIVAVDYSQEAIKKAKERLPGVSCLWIDITDLSQLRGNFDCVILLRTLQSLSDPDLKVKVLTDIKSKLVDDGRIVIIEGNAKRLTKHPKYNFYLSYNQWKNVFEKTGYSLCYASSIPLSTLLAMLDGKFNYYLRKRTPLIYIISYFLDRFFGKINPGLISHEFAMVIKKDKNRQ